MFPTSELMPEARERAICENWAKWAWKSNPRQWPRLIEPLCNWDVFYPMEDQEPPALQEWVRDQPIGWGDFEPEDWNAQTAIVRESRRLAAEIEAVMWKEAHGFLTTQTISTTWALSDLEGDWEETRHLVEIKQLTEEQLHAMVAGEPLRVSYALEKYTSWEMNLVRLLAWWTQIEDHLDPDWGWVAYPKGWVMLPEAPWADQEVKAPIAPWMSQALDTVSLWERGTPFGESPHWDITTTSGADLEEIWEETGMVGAILRKLDLPEFPQI